MLDSGLCTTIVFVSFQQRHLGWADMDAVNRERLFAEDAVFVKALDDALAIFMKRIYLVAGAFRNVDMRAGVGGCAVCRARAFRPRG